MDWPYCARCRSYHKPGNCARRPPFPRARHDPPRVVWSGSLWRDVRPMADLYREETPAVEVLRDPHFWLLLGVGLLVLFGGLPYLRRP